MLSEIEERAFELDDINISLRKIGLEIARDDSLDEGEIVLREAVKPEQFLMSFWSLEQAVGAARLLLGLGDVETYGDVQEIACAIIRKSKGY